jgi:hypothetical protein
MVVFSRVSSVDVTYKRITSVHMTRLVFTMSNSRSRRRDSVVMLE